MKVKQAEMLIFSKPLMVVYLMTVSLCVIAQHSPENYRKELSIKISAIDENRLDRAVKSLNEAYFVEIEAINLVESLPEDEKLQATHPNYKKAVKKLIQTSELYREGHMSAYAMFQENCIKFQEEMKKMRGYSSGLNKAKLYERKSAKAFERSLLTRDRLVEIEKPELIQYKMAEAFELERLAIQHRGRALQIYQDFPVEYDYNWENDITEEEVAAAFKDPAVVRPPDDLFIQSIIVDTANVEIRKHESPIIFRVQIAAHTVEMDEAYIRDNIYPGRLPIKEIFADNWYKYSIGEFSNFREANSLLKNSRVAKAFVVAYQDGKKLTIKSALASIKENQ